MSVGGGQLARERCVSDPMYGTSVRRVRQLAFGVWARESCVRAGNRIDGGTGLGSGASQESGTWLDVTELELGNVSVSTGADCGAKHAGSSLPIRELLRSRHVIVSLLVAPSRVEGSWKRRRRLVRVMGLEL